MKIVILSQYYEPEPVPIPSSLASALAARGHEVRVVTGYPNYPSGIIADGYRQRLRFVEMRDGIPVHRVPLFVSHSRSAMGRLLSYLSFGISSRFVAGAFRGADVVYVYATQMTAAMAALSWWRRGRIPFVLHVQDLWPESVTGSAMMSGGIVSRMVNTVLQHWLRSVYGSAAATIAIGPRMRSLLIERGVPSRRAYDVLNWAQNEQAMDRPVRAANDTNVMYAGNMGEMQDLRCLMQACALVRDLNGFRVTMVGSGVDVQSLHRLREELQLTNVTFIDRVQADEMPRLYEESDFQLVTLKALSIFEATIPSKLQASLAAGVPVITTVNGDVADIVTRHGLGFHSVPSDPDSLARTFRSAHALSSEERLAMSLRARTYYDEAMAQVLGVDSIERILWNHSRSGGRKGKQ